MLNPKYPIKTQNDPDKQAEIRVLIARNQREYDATTGARIEAEWRHNKMRIAQKQRQQREASA